MSAHHRLQDSHCRAQRSVSPSQSLSACHRLFLVLLALTRSERDSMLLFLCTLTLDLAATTSLGLCSFLWNRLGGVSKNESGLISRTLCLSPCHGGKTAPWQIRKILFSHWRDCANTGVKLRAKWSTQVIAVSSTVTPSRLWWSRNVRESVG